MTIPTPLRHPDATSSRTMTKRGWWLVTLNVLLPGSARLDRLLKRSEYADAGIPHYWIVDPSEPVSLLACHQAGVFGYVDDGAVTGTFTATEPFPVEIDLDSLR